MRVLGEGGGRAAFHGRCPLDQEAAGHPKMHYQALLGVEVGDEELASSAQIEDAGAGKTPGEARRKGKPQVRAPEGDFREPPADKHGLEASSHRLDLREFGHGWLPNRNWWGTPRFEPSAGACPAYGLRAAK